MSLHNEPQKHIGTCIPSVTCSLILFHGISVDPEEDIVQRCGGCVVRMRNALRTRIYRWAGDEGACRLCGRTTLNYTSFSALNI